MFMFLLRRKPRVRLFTGRRDPKPPGLREVTASSSPSRAAGQPTAAVDSKSPHLQHQRDGMLVDQTGLIISLVPQGKTKPTGRVRTRRRKTDEVGSSRATARSLSLPFAAALPSEARASLVQDGCTVFDRLQNDDTRSTRRALPGHPRNHLTCGTKETTCWSIRQG